MDPATDWVDGRLGTALNFDGSDDHVSVGDNSLLDINSDNDFSFGLWLKSSTAGNTDRVLDKFDAGRGGYKFIVESDGSIRATVGDSDKDTLNVSTSKSLIDGTWHHLLAVWDSSSSTLKVYVDGSLTKQRSDNAIDASMTNGQNLFIAQRGGDARFFPGRLDDLRIYDRALTKANVQDLYQSGFSKVNTSRKLDNIGGLTGWWTMDGKNIDWSASSGQIKDSSGFGNDGTTNGGMTNESAAQGRVGQALEFDGVDDRISISDSDSFNLTSFTLSAWIKTKDAGSDRRRIISQQPTNTDYWLMALQDNVLEMGSSKDSILTAKGGGLADNQWHHVSVIRDAGNKAYWYVDGVKVGETGITNSDSYTFNTNVLVGKFEGGSEHINGKVDDVRIYDQALTANQITRLYNATRPSPINTSRTDRLTAGLVGFWSMNGQDVDLSDSTAEVKDVSGNDNDGNAKNGASPAIGKLGQGFGFDGTDDYVEVPDSSLWDFAGKSRTVSVWFQANENQPTGYPRFFDHFAGGSPGAGWLFGFDAESDNIFFTHRADGNNIVLQSPNTYNDGMWHHAVTTLDGSTARLYIDGSKVDTDNYSSLNDLDKPLDIGSDRGNGNEFKGSLDNARIYSRALSESEVKKLYRLGE